MSGSQRKAEEAMIVARHALEAVMEASAAASELPIDDDMLDATLVSKPWKAAMESAQDAARANVSYVAEKIAGRSELDDYDGVATAVRSLLDRATAVLALNASAGTTSDGKKRRRDDEAFLQRRTKVTKVTGELAMKSVFTEVPKTLLIARELALSHEGFRSGLLLPCGPDDGLWVDSLEVFLQTVPWVFAAKEVALLLFGQTKGAKAPCVLAARKADGTETEIFFDVEKDPTLRDRLVTVLRAIFAEPSMVKIVTCSKLPPFITSTANVVDFRMTAKAEALDDKSITEIEIDLLDTSSPFDFKKRIALSRKARSRLELFDRLRKSEKEETVLVKVDEARSTLHRALKNMRLCRNVLRPRRLDECVEAADALWRSSAADSLDVEQVVQLAWKRPKLDDDDALSLAVAAAFPEEALKVLKTSLQNSMDKAKQIDDPFGDDANAVAAASPNIVLRGPLTKTSHFLHLIVSQTQGGKKTSDDDDKSDDSEKKQKRTEKKTSLLLPEEEKNKQKKKKIYMPIPLTDEEEQHQHKALHPHMKDTLLPLASASCAARAGFTTTALTTLVF